MIRIASDALAAEINPLGAELTSLKDADGRELMTDANPAFWTGHAPVLFPVVGRPHRDTIHVDGGEYPMAQHGFARRLPFAVEAHGDDHARFVLTDSAETRRHYPFAFRLQLDFRVEGATLAIGATIANPNAEALPASLGFHPAFAWPLPYGYPRADHRITLSHAEPEPLRTIAADGTIAEGSRPSPLDDRTLHLADELFVRDALVWDQVRSSSATYGASDGPQLRVDFPDTPMLGIWTKPGAAFVCIEPWHGIADPEGYTGDLRDKPGIFAVAPGEEKQIVMKVTLER